MPEAYCERGAMVLRSYMYGNPETWLDRKRADDKAEKERKEKLRKHKARRIASLTRLAMRGKHK